MRQGHFISERSLRQTAVRLLSAAYAEYEWPELRRDSDPDVLDDLLAESDDEISELMVTLATQARVQDDELLTLDAVTRAFPTGVGVLTTPRGDEPLSPREACNKVIHAKTVRLDLRRSDRNPLYEGWYASQGVEVRGDFKDPVAVLTGTHRGKQWTAEVRLVRFAVAVGEFRAWR